jgi:hypothetical protein
LLTDPAGRRGFRLLAFNLILGGNLSRPARDACRTGRYVNRDLAGRFLHGSMISGAAAKRPADQTLASLVTLCEAAVFLQRLEKVVGIKRLPEDAQRSRPPANRPLQDLFP